MWSSSGQSFGWVTRSHLPTPASPQQRLFFNKSSLHMKVVRLRKWEKVAEFCGA